MKKLAYSILASLVVTMSSHAADNDKLNQHVIGAFAGITDSDYSNEASYGLEYEYRFNSAWGIGGVWEKTPDGHNDGHGHKEDISVKVISAYWHKDYFRLGLGIGQEKVHGDHSHTEDLIRASAAYDFHLTPNLGIAPSVAIDRVDGQNVYVYGAAITYAF